MPICWLLESRQMARPRNGVPRASGEYKGYLWVIAPVCCPKCKATAKALVSCVTRRPSAMECTKCDWYSHAEVKPKRR